MAEKGANEDNSSKARSAAAPGHALEVQALLDNLKKY
jgi:hypothetical protein